jgi:hypothetical protein
MPGKTPLSPEEAKQKILLIIEEGDVEPSWHCRTVRMRERHVDMDDILRVLEYGEITRAPEWSEEHLNWKYRVEGADVEGDDLAAVTVIIEEQMTLLIVTVF